MNRDLTDVWQPQESMRPASEASHSTIHNIRLSNTLIGARALLRKPCSCQHLPQNCLRQLDSFPDTVEIQGMSPVLATSEKFVPGVTWASSVTLLAAGRSCPDTPSRQYVNLNHLP